MQRRYVPSIDQTALVVLGTGMLGFVVLYSYLLSENPGPTVSIVRWSWFTGLGFVLALSAYLWFTWSEER